MPTSPFGDELETSPFGDEAEPLSNEMRPGGQGSGNRSRILQDETISGTDVARALLQGLTFGTSDEIGAIVAAAAAKMTGSEDRFVDIYKDIHGLLGDEREAFSDQNPGLALGLELVGAIPSGAAVGGQIMRGLSGLPRLARLAAAGGTEGAIYGAATGDDVGDRASRGAVGGVAGAVGGVAVPLVGQLAGSTAHRITEPLGNVARRMGRSISRDPAGDARRALSSQIAREGVDFNDPALRGPEGLDLTLADVSQGAKNLAAGLAADVDNPQLMRIVEGSLKTRNAGLTNRVFKFFDDAIEVPGNTTAAEAVATLRSTQAAAAAPLYAEAAKVPIKPTRYMRTMLEEGEDASIQWKRAIKQTASSRNAGEEVTHFTVLDRWKKNMDDVVERYMRQGDKNAAKDAIIVKNKILAEIDRQNPAYKKARDVWAGDQQLINAVERGKRVLREDIDELAEYFDGLSASEKSFYKLGVQKAVRDKLMSGREGTQVLNRIRSQLNMERFKRIFPSDKAFNDFKKRIDIEADAFETYRLLAQGSKTGRVQSAQKWLYGGSGEEIASPITKTLRDIFGMPGMSPEAKSELGRLVLTPISELGDDALSEVQKAVQKNMHGKMLDWSKELFYQSYDAASVSTGVAIPQATEGNI